MADQLQLGVWEPAGGLWAVSVICSTPESRMELEGRWFSLAKGNPHLGAPGRAALARPVSKSQLCIWMG